MAVDIFINFNGNCREAVEFYANVFGTQKPHIMTYGDAPPDPEFPVSEATKNLVMFTNLKIQDSNILFSDTPPEMPFVAGSNISLVINSKNKDEIKILFNKMKEDGSVALELQETFWSKYYGMLTDKFGISWQFNYDSGQKEM